MVTTTKIQGDKDALVAQFPLPVQTAQSSPRDFNSIGKDLSEKTDGTWELTPASSFIRRHAQKPIPANDLVRSEEQKKSGFFMLDMTIDE